MPFEDTDPGFDIPVTLELLDGKGEQVWARIRRVNAGFFQLWSRRCLRQDQDVAMHYEGRRIEAEVVYCQKHDLELHLVGIKTKASGDGMVRKQLRLPVDVRGTLIVAGSSKPMKIRIIDMAQTGLGLRVPKALAVGTQVLIDLGHGVAFGEIRHCSAASKASYRVGFLMEEFIYRSVGKLRRPADGETGLLQKIAGLFRRS